MGGYDIIGDVHGCSEPLEGLLETLGYVLIGSVWTPPLDRQAVFVGDLIDRGPNQLRVLEIVKPMVDAGVAQITMGNHELNALCWSTEDPDHPGEYLRRHSKRNRRQHAAFLDQLTRAQRTRYLEWFLTIPLWLDLDGVRVVHACWHEESRALIEDRLGGDHFTQLDQLVEASTSTGPLNEAIETLLKGPEMRLASYDLPSFADKDGTPRSDARVRWWETDSDRVVDLAEIPRGALTPDGARYPVIDGRLIAFEDHQFDLHDGTPIVYGHYWRKHEHGVEVACTINTACVDFSAVKGGPLAAYRWSEGEDTIDASRYVTYR